MTQSDHDIQFWSTRQVAERLRVSEATVKRWSDEGLLRCSRTPGGHRKFNVRDVASFAASHDFAGMATGDLKKTDAADVLKLALKSNVNGLFDRLRGRLDAGMKLEQLLDDLVTPALVEIGERWARGEATVAEEHVVTQTVCDALARIRPLLVGETNRGVAISACMPGERHDVAARMVALVLGVNGYRALTPGADTPVKALHELVTARSAKLLALSASSTYDSIGQLKTDLLKLSRETKLEGTQVIVGGVAFERIDPLPAGITLFSNMTELSAWLA